MKAILRSTNNGKTVTSVFILKLNPSGNDTYLRKYTYLLNGGIYVFDLTGGNDKSTDLKSLDNLTGLKAWDNINFGGEFHG